MGNPVVPARSDCGPSDLIGKSRQYLKKMLQLCGGHLLKRDIPRLQLGSWLIAFVAS